MSNVIELPNGASIYRDPKANNKFAVFAPDGSLQGYRRDEARAREFASSLVGERIDLPQPAPVHISHRAHAEVKRRAGVVVEEPTGPRADEKPMPVKGWPRVVHSKAYEATTGRRHRRN